MNSTSESDEIYYPSKGSRAGIKRFSIQKSLNRLKTARIKLDKPTKIKKETMNMKKIIESNQLMVRELLKSSKTMKEKIG